MRAPGRRALLAGGGAALLAAGAGGWAATRDAFDGDTLDPASAHAAAAAGEITLIDVRRPDEWEATGMPRGAVPIDMRRDDFLDALDAAIGGDRAASVAIICARGVRSDRVSARLSEAGFTRVIDVPEGMLGSGAGPGWLARELPVAHP